MRKKPTKPQLIEERLNALKNYEPCWVYREGKEYLIQSVGTGAILKHFYSYTDIEEYVISLEEEEERNAKIESL